MTTDRSRPGFELFEARGWRRIEFKRPQSDFDCEFTRIDFSGRAEPWKPWRGHICDRRWSDPTLCGCNFGEDCPCVLDRNLHKLTCGLSGFSIAGP